MSTEAWAFLSLAFTTLVGFGNQWLQTRKNHAENRDLIGSLVAQANECGEHLVTDHGHPARPPLVMPTPITGT